jgi:hypothetical protein
MSLEQLQDKIGNRELQANKNLEKCPLRVQELEQSGHLLIEVSNDACISFSSMYW